MFIAAQADKGRAVATLEHRLAAIRLMHLGQGLPSPHNTLVVEVVMRGLRRVRAVEADCAITPHPSGYGRWLH